MFASKITESLDRASVVHAPYLPEPYIRFSPRKRKYAKKICTGDLQRPDKRCGFSERPETGYPMGDFRRCARAYSLSRKTPYIYLYNICAFVQIISETFSKRNTAVAEVFNHSRPGKFVSMDVYLKVLRKGRLRGGGKASDFQIACCIIYGRVLLGDGKRVEVPNETLRLFFRRKIPRLTTFAQTAVAENRNSIGAPTTFKFIISTRRDQHPKICDEGGFWGGGRVVVGMKGISMFEKDQKYLASVKSNGWVR